MFISSWFSRRNVQQPKGRSRPHQAPRIRCRTRLTCEQLEDRTVPSNFTAATVSDLIADINAANAAGGSNTIALVAGKTFTLTTPVFYANNGLGGVITVNGLPAILANDNLTIQGNGDMILRSATAPAFRLLAVTSGAALTLENLTLKGGLAEISNMEGDGGAIYNSGVLTLSAVTVTGNSAVGAGWGLPGQGGGIYSASATSSLTLETGTVITNNSAVGSTNGNGYGGGVYLAGGGTATLTGVTLSYNTAQGGNYGPDGDWGGQGAGGALFAFGETISLRTIGQNPLTPAAAGLVPAGDLGGSSHATDRLRARRSR